MLSLLSQIDTYSPEAGESLTLLILIVVVLIISVVSLGKIFVKAGRPGWQALIPFYNGWATAQIAGKPGWFILLPPIGFIIPIVGPILALVIPVIIAIELSKSFGKQPIFALWLLLLPIVGYPMLAFGDARYVSPGGKPRI